VASPGISRFQHVAGAEQPCWPELLANGRDRCANQDAVTGGRRCGDPAVHPRSAFGSMHVGAPVTTGADAGPYKAMSSDQAIGLCVLFNEYCMPEGAPLCDGLFRVCDLVDTSTGRWRAPGLLTAREALWPKGERLAQNSGSGQSGQPRSDRFAFNGCYHPQRPADRQCCLGWI